MADASSQSESPKVVERQAPLTVDQSIKIATDESKESIQSKQTQVADSLLPDNADMMSDPVQFWKNWSCLKSACEKDLKEGQQCSCFEGLGSVM